MDFYETIGELINSGREDDYWDFKQQYHANRAELIHDMKNASLQIWNGAQRGWMIT